MRTRHEDTRLQCKWSAGPTLHQLLKSGHQIRALVRDVNRTSPLSSVGGESAGKDGEANFAPIHDSFLSDCSSKEFVG